LGIIFFSALLSVSQLSLGLTLLSVEKEILNKIDYDNLINNFASQKDKKKIIK
jgi:hypothetical protein